MLRQLGTQSYASMLYNCDLMVVTLGLAVVSMYIALGRQFGAYDCVASKLMILVFERFI